VAGRSEEVADEEEAGGRLAKVGHITIENDTNLKWTKIDDIEVEPWRMALVSSLKEATKLTWGNAHQATRGADQKFSAYTWEPIPHLPPNEFVVQGTPKR
jgi:hypothetical protein